MAIIYTYPVKTDPVAADKVLISDSEDNNKTKSVTIDDIRQAATSGVSSIVAGSNITINPAGGTGDVTVNATAYTAGDGIDINSYVVSADLKANSGLVIDATELSLDLSASAITGTLGVKDGGTGAQTFTAGFLKADGVNAFTTVAQIDLSTDVTDGLGVANGGTGATTLTGVLVGNGTSAITGGGSIDDLADAQFSSTSLYIANIPSGLSGNPTANIIIGSGSGNLITTGASNTLIGDRSGDVLTTGGFNTIIGANADSSAAGNRSGIAIGAGATVGDGGIAIGRAAEADDNQLALGSTTYALDLEPAAGGVITYLVVVVNGTTYHLPLHDPTP